MWPGITQGVHALRGDENNPIHSLDGWLLATLQKQLPCSVHELADSCAMRMGPRAKGPELDADAVAMWIRDAVERGAVESAAGEDPAKPRWSLTAAGEAKMRKLRGLKARIGGGLGLVLRMPSRWAHAVARLEEQKRVLTDTPPPPRRGLPTIEVSPGDSEISPEQALQNLKRVKHIVVLMMENRSFDHMLGYLSLLDGQTKVRGLRDDLPPVPHDGTDYKPEYLVSTAFPKSMDPPHGKEEIAKQINGGKMDGFIESFARENDVPKPELAIGYYTHRELPVYDHFAHNFLLCDQWFSSVPAATWPNRLFAVAGTCDRDREGLFDGGERFFDKKSFVRLLADEENEDTWRWYSWDPGSLRFIDDRYRLNPLAGFHHDHFRRVAQHSIEPGERAEGGNGDLELGSGFLEDAAAGDLPRVAWIDPNFVDLSILDSNSNDDHPPSDVRAGQELAMLVYRALAQSPCWEETMLVVTYDEHGGFYDHEPPPAPPEAEPPFDTYGVRVPTFVVSPLVEPGTVSHTVFDHASIVRTILERFGVEGAVEQIAQGAPRVAAAEHLGRLLTRRPAPGEGPPDFSLPNAALEGWRHGRAKRRSAAAPELLPRGWDDPDVDPRLLTGFPAEFIDGARGLRNDGLPAGHP